MPRWEWLERPNQPYTWGFALRVVVKAAVLFALLNGLFALVSPLDVLGRLSLYNVLLAGRERLPYGENPAQSYNISLYNLPAMFASHRVAQRKADGEFRVLLIGDSATWGWLLENAHTLAGMLNAGEHVTAEGGRVVVYNLGYPIMSLTKDLMLLDYAMRYDPDAVVWLVTLESFPRSDQLRPPILQNNAARVRELIGTYGLDLDPDDARLIEPGFYGQAIIGQRRALADLVRLQVYGAAWSITGVDQHIPDDYDLRASDFDEDVSWHGYDEPQTLTTDDLAFDVLAAGIERVGNVPLLLVNEPMFISDGRNSDLRYNFFYPRWAYDVYRDLLHEMAVANGWRLLDLWDALPPDEFTDSPVHTTPEGSRQLAELLAPALLELAEARR
jgi:lysophospholipase L1-like esterase